MYKMNSYTMSQSSPSCRIHLKLTTGQLLAGISQVQCVDNEGNGVEGWYSQLIQVLYQEEEEARSHVVVVG